MSEPRKDLVIGIDSSTQSTKAIAFDANGNIVAVGTAPIPLSSPGRDRYEQDATDWWTSLRAALAGLWQTVDPLRVTALAIANQRETNVCLDAAGTPLRPALVWLDERARAQLPLLERALGGTNIHRITGKPLDLTPTLGRIAWLRDNEPATYERTATFCDVHAYLVLRLTGTIATSWASADPSGLFDVRTRQWSEPILRELRLTADRLPPACAPGTDLGGVTPEAAAFAGLAAGTRIIAAATVNARASRRTAFPPAAHISIWARQSCRACGRVRTNGRAIGGRCYRPAPKATSSKPFSAAARFCSIGSPRRSVRRGRRRMSSPISSAARRRCRSARTGCWHCRIFRAV